VISKFEKARRNLAALRVFWDFHKHYPTCCCCSLSGNALKLGCV
jgi:hypothetical protein